MADLDLDETYQAKVCAAKCAWQEALEAVNAQRNTMEGAKVIPTGEGKYCNKQMVFTDCSRTGQVQVHPPLPQQVLHRHC